MNEKERNQLAKQFLPLVKKISLQMCGKSNLEYDEIEGFAWEGFVLAMNQYDSTRSSMSFKSYAAYGIRNAILNGINNYSRTISVSYYKHKQMQTSGEMMPTTISLEKNFDNEDHLEQLGLEDDVLFDSPYTVLLKKLNHNFNSEWVDMFCAVYGICGHRVEKSKDIAARLGVSPCLITQRIKKMIRFIKCDKELTELLRDLL